MRLIPKGWRDFQHYANRNPPWIRLHRKLLDDRDFQGLPIASRALAPMLWLLASESKDGSFNGSAEELAFRLRTSQKEITAGLKPLIDKGFFIVDSSVLAECEQVAANSLSETETETETETDLAPTVLVASDGDAKPYAVPSCPYAEIVKAYGAALPTLAQVSVLNDARKSHVSARWREVCAAEKFDAKQGVEWFADFFALVAGSAFLTGNGAPRRDTGRVWAADFDWLMKPSNFAKVVDGNYQDRRAA